MAMELYSGQRWRKPYKRLWALFESFGVWAGIRLSDHWGIPPKGVKLGPRGLRAALLESKTTGPGRRIEELLIWIGVEAYLVRDWKEDFAEMVEAYATDRDFLMARPKADLVGHYPEARVDWEEGNGMLQALLQELPLPVLG